MLPFSTTSLGVSWTVVDLRAGKFNHSAHMFCGEMFLLIPWGIDLVISVYAIEFVIRLNEQSLHPYTGRQQQQWHLPLPPTQTQTHSQHSDSLSLSPDSPPLTGGDKYVTVPALVNRDSLCVVQHEDGAVGAVANGKLLPFKLARKTTQCLSFLVRDYQQTQVHSFLALPRTIAHTY